MASCVKVSSSKSLHFVSDNDKEHAVDWMDMCLAAITCTDLRLEVYPFRLALKSNLLFHPIYQIESKRLYHIQTRKISNIEVWQRHQILCLYEVLNSLFPLHIITTQIMEISPTKKTSLGNPFRIPKHSELWLWRLCYILSQSPDVLNKSLLPVNLNLIMNSFIN